MKFPGWYLGRDGIKFMRYLVREGTKFMGISAGTEHNLGCETPGREDFYPNFPSPYPSSTAAPDWRSPCSWGAELEVEAEAEVETQQSRNTETTDIFVESFCPGHFT